MFIVCCTGWRRIACYTDEAVHMLGLTIRPLCDLHDRLITGEWLD